MPIATPERRICQCATKQSSFSAHHIPAMQSAGGGAHGKCSGFVQGIWEGSLNAPCAGEALGIQSTACKSPEDVEATPVAYPPLFRRPAHAPPGTINSSSALDRSENGKGPLSRAPLECRKGEVEPDYSRPEPCWCFSLSCEGGLLCEGALARVGAACPFELRTVWLGWRSGRGPWLGR
jgi:hypothetical protein